MSWIDAKYIQLVGVQLLLFKKKRDNLWNFRCPFCGDSEKDQTKARGYIFLHDGNYKYKCHNCGHPSYFSTFLKDVSPELYKQYRMELFKENSGGKSRKPKDGEAPKPKFKRRNRTKKPDKPKIEIPAELEGMEPVSMLPEDHFVRKYVEGRGIPQSRWNGLFWSKDMRFMADRLRGYEDTYFDNFPRLLLPFINREGKMTHIQGRAIGDKVPKGGRYYTLEVIEDSPKVYGLNMIDDTKPVKVVEGPIDSLFLPNCAGMGGADVPWDLFDPANTIFVWDNERRSKTIVKKMREAVDRGFAINIWDRSIRQKDINDMVLAGRSPEQLDNYILNHSYRGLKAKMALAQL